MNLLTRRALLAKSLPGAGIMLLLARGGARIQARPLDLQLRHGKGKDKATESTRLDTRYTAVVVVDMWTTHGCAGATACMRALVPRMNTVLNTVRALGIPVIFAPSGDDLKRWEGKPQRTRIDFLPHHPMSASNGFLAGHGIDGPFTSPCMCKVTEVNPVTGAPVFHCRRLMSDHNQNPELNVSDQDLFLAAGRYRPGVKSAIRSWGEPAQQELWDFVREKGITHLLYLGCATNMCVINREFGMIQMERLGLEPILVRDMTMAMTFDGYNPITKRLDPSFTPEIGTAYAIEYIEENIGPSIESAQLLHAVFA
jgi:nicotinamidase-related amidase